MDDKLSYYAVFYDMPSNQLLYIYNFTIIKIEKVTFPKIMIWQNSPIYLFLQLVSGVLDSSHLFIYLLSSKYTIDCIKGYTKPS